MHIAEAYQLRTKKQAAKYFNCSPATIERYMRDGLEYIKFKGLVRFTPQALEAYAAKNVRGKNAA
jgi:hypothetical protein